MTTPVNLSVIKAFRMLNAFEYAGEKLSLSQLTRMRLGIPSCATKPVATYAAAAP